MEDPIINKLKEENKALLVKYKALEQKERITRIINNFSTSILEQDSVDDILWGIAKNVIAKLGFVDCVVYWVDHEKQLLYQKAAHGPKNPIDFEIYNKISIPLGKGVVGTVAQTGIPELVNDTSIDPRYIVDDTPRLSELAVPIITEDKVIGVIDSEHPERGFFTQEHVEILMNIAQISSIRIMNAIAKKKLGLYKDHLELLVDERTMELNEAIKELKNSNRDLEHYAYAASHDLQAPLRTISNFLQVIQMGEENLSEESKRYMTFVIDGTQRMQNLLEGLLEYSSLRSKKMKKRDVRIKDIMEITLHNLSYEIEKTKARIDYPNDFPIVKGFSSLLSQLFQNLIANSIKFSQKDIPPHIKISFQEKEHEYMFEFQDNGIGIETQYKEKVFNLFARLNNHEDYKGSGLGLSMCERIVEKHDGEIRLVSEGLGKGSKFIFTLSKNE